MADPWSEGYSEGLRGDDADTRYCGWEGTDNVLRWLDGFHEGQKRARGE